jgi:hypothetical protein
VQQRVGGRRESRYERLGGGERRLALLAAPHHLADVVTTAERRIRTGDHDAPGSRVGGAADVPFQRAVHGVGEGVAGLGTVQGDDGDVVVAEVPRDVGERVGHGSPLRPFAAISDGPP